MRGVELAEELSLILESQKRTAWHSIVTLDGSYFYSRPGNELIWLQPGEEVPEREGPTIQSEKRTLTMIWNP
jgi:predicted cupin superfamily sugar epimerase